MSTMPTTAPRDLCPCCYAQFLASVSCGHDGCGFAVTVCPTCDSPETVAEFVTAHEADCAHQTDDEYVDRLLQLARPTA